MYERMIAIWGMPRSGTSWLSQLFDSHPEVRYRSAPFVFQGVRKREDGYVRLFEDAYDDTNPNTTLAGRRRDGHYPIFQKTTESVLVVKHNRYHDHIRGVLEAIEAIHVVFLVRHPCGAIHSWMTSGNEYPQKDKPELYWRSGKNRNNAEGEFWGFDDWKTVTRMHVQFAADDPERCTVVRYEDLVDRTRDVTEELFGFCGLDMTQQTEDFIVASRARHDPDPYAVFKDPRVRDRWKTELSAGIRDEILNDIEGTDLERFL